MSKIYSRKRFILKPKMRKIPHITGFHFTGSSGGKIIKICILTVVIMLTIETSLNHIDPIFEGICEAKLKSVATIITNQESTKIMNKYQYDELYTIEKDANGDITIIRANVVPINNMISDLTENIQNGFENSNETEIDIPMGNLSGLYFLSGTGPNIPIKILLLGTVDTEVKSEFVSKGINQTLHRIYVEFYCNMRVATPVKNYDKSIINQVIVAEHVIVGSIPDTYYNLEGMTGVDDVLNVID